MNIILYVMDSLRPDFLSCYDYHKKTSPNIDKIAEDGVVFENCFAQSTWTRPSGASILTSTYPSVHKVITTNDILTDKIPTLPTFLEKKGFKNIAISAMGNISPSFGFGNSFDHFVELYKENGVIKKRVSFENKGFWRSHFKSDYVSIATSEDANDFLFPLLENYVDENVFVLIWSIDTHNPYFHREPRLARFCKETKPAFWDEGFFHKEIYNRIWPKHRRIEQRRLLYEDMIYYNDYHIGILTDRLKKLKQYDNTLLIITSDHGEGFGEHDLLAHAGVPYEEQIKVPLIIKFPMSENRGRIKSLVQHIDIMPTILEYLDLKENDIIQGKSIITLISDEKKRINDFIFCETKLHSKFPKYVSVRNNDYKYIKIEMPKFKFEWSLKYLRRRRRLRKICKGEEMLFFIKEDKDERKNVIELYPNKVDELKSSLNSFSEDNKDISLKLNIDRHTREVDKTVKKQLRALGYID